MGNGEMENGDVDSHYYARTRKPPSQPRYELAGIEKLENVRKVVAASYTRLL